MLTRTLKLGFFALLLSLVTGCELVGDIFETGMAVGIFAVIAVIAIIVWAISRFKK